MFFSTGVKTSVSTIVGIITAFVPRFSVSNFWPEVERSGATIASILGSMGAMLANAPDREDDRFRVPRILGEEA